MCRLGGMRFSLSSWQRSQWTGVRGGGAREGSRNSWCGGDGYSWPYFRYLRCKFCNWVAKFIQFHATNIGDNIGMDSDEDESIREAIRWLVVSTSSSYHGDDKISTVKELSDVGRLHRLRTGNGFRPWKILTGMGIHPGNLGPAYSFQIRRWKRSRSELVWMRRLPPGRAAYLHSPIQFRTCMFSCAPIGCK